MTALEEFSAEINVLGTTPYVETIGEASLKTKQWAVRTALKYSLHLDFHNKYNIDNSNTVSPSNR